MGDMNAPLRVRTREGCRGGQEQFKWTQIKDQEFKDREQYLGQSTRVGMMGKFGRYYVHDWYARKRDTVEKIESERSSVQAYEEELMQEALGLKPKRLLLAKKQLTEEELKEFLKRDEDKSADKKGMTPMGPQKKIVTNEYGEQIATSNEDYVAVAAREAPIKGLGFAAHRTAKLEAIKAEAFGTESQLAGSKSQSSSAKPEKSEMKDEVKDEPPDEQGAGGPGVVEPRVKEELTEAEHGEGPRGGKRRRREEEAAGGEEEDRRSKKERKEEKKRRKAEKKLKKLEKKLRKVAKKERKKKPGCSSSSSSSSS